MRAKRPKCRWSGKVAYTTPGDAASAAEYLMAVDYRRDLRLFVYKCPHCNVFHLTKRTHRKGPQPRKEPLVIDDR